MSFLSLLGPLLGGVGSLVAGNQQSHQYSQLEQMVNQIMGQAQQVQGDTLSSIQGLQGEAGQYTSQLPQLAQLFSQLGTGAGSQAPGAASSYETNAMSPSALASLTGINAGGLTSNATNYLSQPGSTNLAGVTPGVMSTYANEMTNGLNPQVQQNAQSQLQQQFDTSQNTIRANAAPGQNINAETQAAQNGLLSNSTNLAGTLAGENQQVRQQGAQGLTSAASGLDAQTQQMLTGAAQLGNNYNQTVLGNQASGASFGQQLMQALQGFVGQGNSLSEFGTSALGSLGSQVTQEGEYFGGLGAQAGAAAAQNNPFSVLGNMLSGMNFGGSGGGSGGSGGITNGLASLDPQAMGGYTSPNATATYAMGGAF